MEKNNLCMDKLRTNQKEGKASDQQSAGSIMKRFIIDVPVSNGKTVGLGLRKDEEYKNE